MRGGAASPQAPNGDAPWKLSHRRRGRNHPPGPGPLSESGSRLAPGPSLALRVTLLVVTDKPPAAKTCAGICEQLSNLLRYEQQNKRQEGAKGASAELRVKKCMGDPQPSACQRRQLGARGPECVFGTKGQGTHAASSRHRPSLFQQDCAQRRGRRPRYHQDNRVHSRFGSQPSGLLLCLHSAQQAAWDVWCGRQPAAEARAHAGCVSQEHSHTTCPLCPASPAGLLPARAARNQPPGSWTAPAPSLLGSPSTHSQLPPRSTGLWVLCAGLALAIRENPLFPHCAGQGLGFEVPAPEPTCLPWGPAAHRPGLLPSSICGLCSTQHPSCLPSVHPSVRQRLSR